MMTSFQLFYYISLLTGVCVCGYCCNKISAHFKILCALVLFTFLSELTAKFLSYIIKNNSIVYHFFTPIEYAFYAWIFLRLLHYKFKKAVYVSIFLIISFEIFNTIFFQSLYVINTNTILLESSLLVILSVLLFNRIAFDSKYHNWKKDGVFLFNSAILLYYASSCLIWGFHSYMIKRIPVVAIYNFLLIFSGLLYLSFSFAICMDKKLKSNMAMAK